jgi:hypothetical protein
MKVKISYFKPSGKWHADDDDAEWPRDPKHYTGWAPFEDVVCLKDMFAVCMETPLGFPQLCYPKEGVRLQASGVRSEKSSDSRDER